MKKERKIIMTLSGDGHPADELGRLERTIRQINYTRRKNKDTEIRFNYSLKGDLTNEERKDNRTGVEGRDRTGRSKTGRNENLCGRTGRRDSCFSSDMKKPPIVLIDGKFVDVATLLGFAISKFIDETVAQGTQRAHAERITVGITQQAIATSRAEAYRKAVQEGEKH